MSRQRSYAGSGSAVFVLFALFVVALTAISLFVGLGTASGAADPDDSTLGIGTNRSTLSQDYSFDAAYKLGAESAQESPAEPLTQATERVVSSASTEAVVELAAVDLGDPATVLAAAKVGVLNPAKDTARKPIDTSGEGWLIGEASGYDIESSSTLTRSGRAFDDDCVTVAVPEGMEDLLGHPVIIVYGDQVVVATVTDTGGFAKYGRALDLAGGVFGAFGYEDIWEWGVREVKYKFL